MKSFTRRNFLRQTTWAAGLASTLPAPLLRIVRAQTPGANDRIRLGLIGCGGQGRVDLQCFLGNPQIECAVLCDVDEAQLLKGLKVCQEQRGQKPDTVKDFRRVLDRRDVDVVLIATPDHWHALPTVMACQAGKDVYVEKPLAKTIDEGRAMLEAAHRHQRIVQMGSQWRSCQHLIEATDLIRSGRLGKVSLARAWAYLDWLPSLGHVADAPPPAGVDYDLWLGPAPRRAFNPNRFHFNFRWFWDYAGGLMTDWGVHLINMLQMGMGHDTPRTISSCGGKFTFDDDTETPDSQVTVFEFPGYQLLWEHRAGLHNGLNGRPWGVEWNGTEATLIADDSGYEIITERTRANLESVKKAGGGDPRRAHVRNFLDCVVSRRQPVLNLDLAHPVSNLAHLGNLAYRTGHKLVWDGVHERVIGDRTADHLVGVEYRKPWHLPYTRRN